MKHTVIGENRDTYDMDFQHRFTFGERQEIVWGFGYRLTHDDLHNTFNATFNPDSRDDDLFSGFIQDEITLVKNCVHMILGSKFEDNDYTGFEIQPNIRILWTPDEDQSAWAAVSRAVRTPSRVEHDVQANLAVIPPGVPPNELSPLPLVYSNWGNEDFESEEERQTILEPWRVTDDRGRVLPAWRKSTRVYGPKGILTKEAIRLTQAS